MTSAIQLNIVSNVDTIHTFHSEDDTSLPDESYSITGVVELDLYHPIHIRQLSVQFEGQIESIFSTSDFFQDTNNTKANDEIPLNKWSTVESGKLMDRLTRKAMGETSATFSILKEKVKILQGSHYLNKGKYSWPFSIVIQNVASLPPSILIPHHRIHYQLSARIKLNSIKERMKISYWQATNRMLQFNPRSDAPSLSPSSAVSTDALSSSSPPLSPESLSFSTLENANKSKRRNLLGVSMPIKICRHSYPSLYSLYQLHRIRYRGHRENHIEYEISMTKFACLQKRSFGFTCRFLPLCPEAKIAKLEYYLEQIETYPIRAGDFSPKLVFSNTGSSPLLPRHRRFSRTTFEMNEYQHGSEIDLHLLLDLPQISPHIQTDMLRIHHKLRLIVRFVDEEKERNMSLSFPITLGTVPKLRSSIDSAERPLIEESDTVHVRQGLDAWLFEGQEQFTASYFEAYNKLPSYRDAIREGNPPSPFF
ncbi:hypothetical protein EDC96DRAFT_493825 [Choanephora cucurbitarum]|nr:hypothetical protein EDC96DRAFT_493825 [Choanephora cucurbitarum]